MSNNIVQSDLNNDIVCEAIDCSSKATKMLTLKVGSKGTISLFLCENCKSLFSSSSHENNRQASKLLEK
jgi:hypothetical protein